jgi:hypothetical protein
MDHYAEAWDGMRITVGILFLLFSIISFIGCLLDVLYSITPVEGVITIQNVRKHVLGMISFNYFLHAIECLIDPLCRC